MRHQLARNRCTLGPLEMTNQKTVKNPYNPPKLIFVVMALACASTPTFAQQECDGYRYRYTGAFEANSVVYDVPYGQNLSWYGTETELVVDIYAPVGDALAERPLWCWPTVGSSSMEATTGWTWCR